MAFDSWRCQSQWPLTCGVQGLPYVVVQRVRPINPSGGCLGERLAGRPFAAAVVASALALAAARKPSADAQEKSSSSSCGQCARQADQRLPDPSGEQADIYGVKSGISKLDKCVRAVPGEVTLVDVVPAPGPRGRLSGADVVLAWVAGIANHEDWRFSVFIDYAGPEEVLCCDLQHLARCNRKPGEQLAWLMEHFRISRVAEEAPLADALEEEEDQLVQGVVLLRAFVASNEDHDLRRKEAARIRRIARSSGKHVWVLRLWEPRADETDELQDICDNHLELRTQATESGPEAVLRVRRVRNSLAGEAGLQYIS